MATSEQQKASDYEINWEEMAKFQASLEIPDGCMFMLHIPDVEASPLFRRKSDSNLSACGTVNPNTMTDNAPSEVR